MAKTRILVVDDEEGMLEVCADTFGKLPETEIVLELQSRQAAARLASESFDLLVTDVRMPGVGGLSLLLHDENLIKIKLTVVYGLLGSVLGVGLLRGKALLKEVLGAHLPLTDEGCIVVDAEKSTPIAGVYAVGDVTCRRTKQAVIAAADGVVAALSIDKYLNKRSRIKPDYE